MKNLYISFFIILVSCAANAQVQIPAPDGTFATNGILRIEFGSSTSVARTIVMQPDGKMIIGGTKSISATIVRINSDGTLDTTYGTGGILNPNFPGSYENIDAMVLQPDNKLIGVGMIANPAIGNVCDLAVVRYNTNGTPDTSFGFQGVVSTDIAGYQDMAHGVALQADGKIVVVGESVVYDASSIGHTDSNFCVARYNTNGSLDTTFNGTGKLLIDFHDGFDMDDDADYGRAIAVDANGKIVVAGISDVEYALARINSDGTFDATFGNDGKIITDLDHEGSNLAEIRTMKILEDGKIIIVGSNYTSYDDGDAFSMAKYNTNGSLDTTFGINGIVNTEFNYEDDKADAIFVLPDGKIILTGTGAGNFAIARYNANGSLDPTLNGYGRYNSYETHGKALGAIMQPDGKIVIAGTYYQDMYLARFNIDGNLAVPENPKDKNIMVYPNPVSDRLNIASDIADSGVLKVKLLDMQGKEIFMQTIENPSFGSIAMEKIAAGSYLLIVEDGKGNQESSIVVKK